MNRFPLLYRFSAVAPALSGGDHPSLVNPATANCATCHETVVAKPVKHPAALDGGCTSCHEFTKAAEKTTAKLSAEEPQLCLTCHDAMAKAFAGTLAAPHAPVTSAYTSCHNPHSTVAPHLLTSAPPAMCLTCHEAATIDPKAWNDGQPFRLPQLPSASRKRQRRSCSKQRRSIPLAIRGIPRC